MKRNKDKDLEKRIDISYSFLMYIGNATLFLIIISTYNVWLIVPQGILLIAQIKFIGWLD